MATGPFTLRPCYLGTTRRGRANAHVQHLREAAETEKPSLETEGPGVKQRRTGKRRPRCLGVRRELTYRCGPHYPARLGGREWP